jgi:hypothetical protein
VTANGLRADCWATPAVARRGAHALFRVSVPNARIREPRHAGVRPRRATFPQSRRDPSIVRLRAVDWRGSFAYVGRPRVRLHEPRYRGPHEARPSPCVTISAFCVTVTHGVDGAKVNRFGPVHPGCTVRQQGALVNVIPRPLRAADGATTRRPHFTWRAGVAAFAALVLGAAMLTIGGSASALNGRRTGPLDNRGFPAYYVDDAGRAVQMCDDGSAICQGANRGDLVAPDGEALYWSALTTLRTRRGPLEVEFALEASFEGQRPVVFRRLRIRGHLGRRGRYILHHPYGNLPFTAIRAREDRNVDVTHDNRCSIRGGRCAPRMDRWLRARSRRPGYLGRNRRTRVRGGTFRNFISVEAPNGRIIGRKARFRVVGKACGRPCRARARRAAR